MFSKISIYSEKSESDSFKLCCYTECLVALRVISGCLRSENEALRDGPMEHLELDDLTYNISACCVGTSIQCRRTSTVSFQSLSVSSESSFLH